MESQEQCVIFSFTYLFFCLIYGSSDIGPDWSLVPETEIILLLKFHYILFKNLVHSQEKDIRYICWFTSMTMTEFQRTTVDHKLCLKIFVTHEKFCAQEQILSKYMTLVKESAVHLNTNSTRYVI